MTSKTSYNNVGKYIWQQLRATRSFILLIAVIYMTIGPLLLAFGMSSLGMATNPLPMLQNLFTDYYMVYYFAAIGLATFGTVYVTRYQNVQTQSNFYHSLPVSRSRLLAGRVLALVIVQLLLLLIVTVANLVASMIFAQSIGESAIVGPLAASAGLHFVYIMLIFFLAMAITLFAGQLTASTLGQLLMTLVLHVTVMVGGLTGSLFLDAFSKTYQSGGLTYNLLKCNIFYFLTDEGTLYNGAGIVNPLMTNNDLVALLNPSQLVWPVSMTMVCLVLTAALLVATFVLYRRRAVEKAGDTLMFSWVGSLVKGIYVLFGGFFGGFAFYGMTDRSFAAFILGVIIAAVIVHIVAEMIYSQDVNGIRQHWLSTVVPVVVAVAVAFLFNSGIVNYDDKLPKADNVKAASIAFGDANETSSDGRGLLADAAKDPAIINKVMAAMQAANAERVTYDDATDNNITTTMLQVTYETTLGGVTTRYYNVPTDEAGKIMAPFLNDAHYYEATWFSLANMKIENLRELYLDVNGFADFSSVDSELTLIDGEVADMNQAERNARLERSEALLKAMQSDLKKRNADVLASRVLGYVSYSGVNDTDFWGVQYPIYANDAATAALLQEWRDKGILQDEASLLQAAMTGMVVKTVNYDNSKQGYTVTGTMSNEDFINAWLAGDFVYTDQANRYGFDINKKKGVIVTDAGSEATVSANEAMRDDSDEAALIEENPQETYSYASFYYTNKANS